jgi:hypothetical protein
MFLEVPLFYLTPLGSNKKTVYSFHFSFRFSFFPVPFFEFPTDYPLNFINPKNRIQTIGQLGIIINVRFIVG